MDLPDTEGGLSRPLPPVAVLEARQDGGGAERPDSCRLGPAWILGSSHMGHLPLSVEACNLVLASRPPEGTDKVVPGKSEHYKWNPKGTSHHTTGDSQYTLLPSEAQGCAKDTSELPSTFLTGAAGTGRRRQSSEARAL